MRSMLVAGRRHSEIEPSAFHVTLRQSRRIGAAATLAALALAAPLNSASAFEQVNDRAKRFSDEALIEQTRRAMRNGGPEAAVAPVHVGRTPEQQRALEAKRDADLARLIDNLKQSDAKFAAKRTPAHTARLPEILPWKTEVSAAPAADLAPEKRSSLGVRPSDHDVHADDQTTRGRATILLVLNQTTGRPPQPVLCVEYGCYISTGAQAPATFMTFSQTTGPIGRIGRGAGACASNDTCVFRSVDLGASGSTPAQPVDLKFARPDRKLLRDIVADGSCRMISGRLSCSRPVRTDDYTMWVVPERIASSVGPEALSAALTAKLQPSTTAELPWLAR